MGRVMDSAGGLLALLSEEQQALQVHGLRGLLSCVDEHWAEVSGAVSQIEAFYEDDTFPQRELAALLAGKVRDNLLLTCTHTIFI